MSAKHEHEMGVWIQILKNYLKQLRENFQQFHLLLITLRFINIITYYTINYETQK